MSKSREEMHDKFVELGLKITYLKGIVQNEGFVPEREQIEEFTKLMDQRISELNNLKENVIWFYS